MDFPMLALDCHDLQESCNLPGQLENKNSLNRVENNGMKYALQQQQQQLVTVTST